MVISIFRLALCLFLSINFGLTAAVTAVHADQPAAKHLNGTKEHQKLEKAIFAAGCFWKVQHVFSKVPGVVRTRAGYSGGKPVNPTYKEVCTDKTGHAEVVQVEFDPAKVTYAKLLETFFTMHNPTTLNSQGPDFGTQYRSAIFCTTPQQTAEATAFKDKLESEHKFKSPIVTVIQSAGPFYDAEDYHQDYFNKHGVSCD